MLATAACPLTVAALVRVLRKAHVGDGRNRIYPVSEANARPFAAALVQFGADFGLTTRLRLAHFLAQCVVEGAWLRATSEFASGAEYDTGEKARRLGNTPERDGDGQRYKGHGRIQVTGKTNHRKATVGLRKRYPEGVQFEGVILSVPDFVANPLALTREPWATLASLMWWADNNGNAEADLGDDEHRVRRVSRGVNRGNYAADRAAYSEEERVDVFCGVAAQLTREGVQ